jgi:hypothetical protein
MLRDLGVNQGAAVTLELGECSFFVSAHQAAVSGDIGRQDGCEPALYAFGGGQGALRGMGEGTYRDT